MLIPFHKASERIGPNSKTKCSSLFQALIDVNVAASLLVPSAHVTPDSNNSPFFQSLLEIHQSVHFLKHPSRCATFPRAVLAQIWEHITSVWSKEALAAQDRRTQRGELSNEEQQNAELNLFQDNMSRFTLNMDEQVIQLFEKCRLKAGVPLIDITKTDLLPADLAHFPVLQSIDIRSLRLRGLFLHHMARLIMSAARFADLGSPSGTSLLADELRGLRSLIPWSIKQTMWTEALKVTRGANSNSGDPPTITIDRFKAFRLGQLGRCDNKATQSVFAQLFRQLKKCPSDILSSSDINSRPVKVTFAGEFSSDAGGPYREVLDMLCGELESPSLELFLPSPNNRSKVGTSQEKWVPNCNCTKPVHISLYEFLGKLMGLALRTGNLLPLNFPSIVWKPVLCLPVTRADVLEVDILSFKILDLMRNMSQDDQSAEFDSLSKFEIMGSDGQMHELIPGGRHKSVTWAKREEYIRLFEQYRLHEFDVQCAAIRRGIASVVPLSVLSLFTWQELEREVCGATCVDVDLLQSHTIYDKCSASDQHVRFFWSMLKDRFDDEQRSRFLRFVWGRSRLPLPGQSWEIPFKISTHSVSENAGPNKDFYLPASHTCFFTLDLPRYSSIDVTTTKIIYAMTHCVTVDTDATLNEGGMDMNADSD